MYLFKCATTYLSENLQICVFPVLEVIVKANNLNVLWTPVVFLGCSPQLHCCRVRKTKIEGVEILYSGDGAFPASVPVVSDWNSLHFLPKFPVLKQGFPSPNMRKEKVKSLWGYEAFYPVKVGDPDF